MAEHMHSGKCQCSAVTYRARGLADIWYCHCRQCRRLAGHFLPACRARREDIEVSGEVRWTAVSENSSHGFCAQCCTPLFWSDKTRVHMSVVCGSLDSTSGIAVRGHIFVSEKGDYYEITDGLPQYSTWPDATGRLTQ